MASDLDNTELWTWAKAGVGVIVSGLAGAVVFLFRSMMTQAAKSLKDTQDLHAEQLASLKNEADDCKQDRRALREENEQIKIRLAVLESRTQSSDEQ